MQMCPCVCVQPCARVLDTSPVLFAFCHSSEMNHLRRCLPSVWRLHPFHHLHSADVHVCVHARFACTTRVVTRLYFMFAGLHLLNNFHVLFYFLVCLSLISAHPCGKCGCCALVSRLIDRIPELQCCWHTEFVIFSWVLRVKCISNNIYLLFLYSFLFELSSPASITGFVWNYLKPMRC